MLYLEMESKVTYINDLPEDMVDKPTHNTHNHYCGDIVNLLCGENRVVIVGFRPDLLWDVFVGVTQDDRFILFVKEGIHSSCWN